MSTKATSAKSGKQLALIAQPNGSQLVRIATKTNTGQRLLTKWEFRRQFNLSRSETETKWAEYVKENAAQFNAQTAALMAAGKLHITSFAVTGAGNITMKARNTLPTPEEVKTTKKEEKAMDETTAMKALGLTPEMLAQLKAMTAANTPAAPAADAPKPAEKAAETPAAAPATPTIDALLAEAGADAAK